MTRGILGGHQQDVKMKPSEILKETYPAHIQVSHYIFGLLLEELDKRFMLNKHSVFSFCRVLQRCVPPLSVMLCPEGPLPSKHSVSSDRSAHKCLTQHL